MRNHNKKVLAGFVVMLVASIVALAFPLINTSAQTNCRTFPETGFQVCGRFLEYWNNNGGLRQQGFPISPLIEEVSPVDGVKRRVQYFERARFEEHTDKAPPNDVLLGLLGVEQFKAKYGQPNPNAELLTVYGKRTANEIGSQKPAAGNVYLIIDVELRNTTQKELSSNPLYFTVRNAQNSEYETASAGYNLPKALRLSRLAYNEVLRGELAFEIPQNENIVSVVFEDFTNKVTKPL